MRWPSRLLELLSGVPTVVYGYFALLFVTPLLQKLIPGLPGFNLLSAGLVMGIMIIPYVSSVSEDAMRAVPMSMREGSYAMGATRFQTAVRVVTPAALSGITAAYILGISRAVGETMILAVAAGMQPNLTWNPMEPAATITSFIVQVALGDLPHGSIGYQTIFAAGLTLMLMTLLFNILGHFMTRKLPAGLLGHPDAHMHRNDLQEIRSLIARHKRWDLIFALVGLAALSIGALTFMALVVDMAIDGAPRLSWDFFTNFPSRRPEQAGILSAWVGSTLVMIVTAVAAIPLGVAGAVYLEEYAPKNWFTDIIEINITNLAGVPSIVYGLLALGLFVYELGLRPEHSVGGPDAGAC